MKFPRNIKVDGYDKVTVTHGMFAVSLNIEDGDESISLDMYASESKALRKALKVAEALVVTPAHRREASE